MHVAPWQRKAHEDSGGFQDLLELHHDGDRASLTADQGRDPEGPLQSPAGGLEEATLQLGPPGPPTVEVLYLHRHACGGRHLDVCLEELRHPIGILIGHQAKAHLRHRLGREHGLGALPRVAAQEPVDVTGGADPELLRRCVPVLSPTQCR